MRELLIVGVDPGTTTGYAVLGTDGKILRMRSSKQLGLNSVVEEIVQLGSVLAIGTDRQKRPQLIEKIAAMTGAKVIQPGYDLTVAEKEGMTAGFAGNQHEKDSLAAALYAHKELEPLLQRIEKTLASEGRQELSREVTRVVVMDGINIREALRQVERQLAERLPAAEKKEKAVAQNEASAEDARTARQLGRMEKENEILTGYASKLLGRIKTMEKERRKMAQDRKPESQAVLQEKAAEKARNRSELLVKLQRILNEKDRQIDGLKAEMRQLEAIAAAGTIPLCGMCKSCIGRIARSATADLCNRHKPICNIAVKKLNTLGFQELQQKNSFLKIGENDIVLVENPDSFSERTLDYLRERNVTILTRKRISTAVARLLQDAGLTALPAEGIILMEAGNFAAADRERMEQARKKRGSNVFGLIENYKEERRIQLQ